MLCITNHIENRFRSLLLEVSTVGGNAEFLHVTQAESICWPSQSFEDAERYVPRNPPCLYTDKSREVANLDVRCGMNPHEQPSYDSRGPRAPQLIRLEYRLTSATTSSATPRLAWYLMSAAS